MQDLIGPRAAKRRALGAGLVSTFAAYGYDVVTTPPFEHAEVLERGLAAIDRRDLLRFVEPETGEVALMRPDITPQIARIVATRLRDRPPPFRLSYEGTVVRRRRGRARKQQLIPQAGVEAIGLPRPSSDAEVITLGARALLAAGLSRFRIELRHVQLAHRVLEPVPAPFCEAVTEALDHKDGARVAALLTEAGVPKAARTRIASLAELYGGKEVLGQARRSLKAAKVGDALAELGELMDHLEDAGIGDHVAFDLGEVRGRAYYTGVSFALLAEGPGEPLGAGGRYDDLLGRFDMPMPATGFAIDLGHLEWALSQSGTPSDWDTTVRVVVMAPLGELAERLRAKGVTVAALPRRPKAEALAFARAWGYHAVLLTGGRTPRILRVDDGAERTRGQDDVDDLLRWVRREQVVESGCRS